MRKILFAFLLALFPLFTFADAVEIDGIYYNLISKTKVAEVTTNPNKYSGVVEIPSSIVYGETEYDVKTIGTSAFYYCTGVTSIIMPNSIKTIGRCAFQYCTNLETIVIPEGVEELPSNVFQYCYKLKSINIPSSITKIGEYAFEYCGVTRYNIESIESWLNITFEGNSSLDTGERHLYINNEEITDITIPDNINTIKRGILANCSGIKTIQFHDRITSIEYAAFYRCVNLTDICLPERITSIDQMAFYECSGLKTINVPNGITTLDNVFAGCSALTEIIIPAGIKKLTGYTFYGCTSLSSIILPNSLEKIGKCSFDGCSNLETIKIGSGVTSVEWNAFANCEKLSDVYCYAKSVPNTNASVFSDSYIEYANLHVPSSSIEQYKSSSPWKSFGNIIGIPMYNLTYLVDNEVYKSYEIEEGATITPEAEPTKEGYTFSGWGEIPATMPAHDVTVTGTFTPAEREYVDLGLPSGRLWAKTNYGAATESEYGEYMDWRSRNAIQETWGEEWATPSSSDMAELYNYCTFTWETLNSVYGCRVTGRNGNSIFLPAAGYKLDGYNVMVGQGIYYWDNNEYESGMAGILSGSATNGVSINATMNYNYATMPIRPVTNLSGVAKYNLTYLLDNEVYKSYEIEEGATITPEAEPTKEGYTFSGWNGLPATMPAHDVTVTGTFTQETGIDQIMDSENGKATIFTIDGKRVDNPKKGVNVIRMKDGTTRKVVVK